MTIKEFKSIARLLKKVYEELEAQAIKEGISLLSPEYTELMDRTRLAVLEKHGFTLEEYRTIKEQVAGVSKEGTLAVMQDTQKKLEEVEGRHIPTEEEIVEIAERVAQKYIVPPQITNQIVKEYTVEQPKIIETTREIVRKETYNDKPLREEIKKVSKKIDDIKIPEPFNIDELEARLSSKFQDNLQDNIDMLGMPDFRKLAMGLQAQIDAGGTGGGYNNLTQFTDQTAWRVFYSNGSGDVTELALGADGTFLKSNGASSAPTFAVPAGSGDVSKVGTPVNNQVGVWTGDGTLEGDAALTFDTTTNLLTTDLITANTGFLPDANDGAYLGQAGTAFSDLFLASGGVINWDSGNVTLTHAFGTLTSNVGLNVPDGAYGAGWNGNLEVPTKNAVYDEMELRAPKASPTFTGTVILPKTIEIQDTTGDHQYVLAVSELVADRTVTLPLLTTADEFVFKDHAVTLTNKTLTSPTINTGTFGTSITGSYLTASEILITDGSKNIVSAPVATYPSLTELTYLKGVTSAIQTQFTGKANTSGALTQFVGNNTWKVWYSDGSGDVQELALGADGTFLKSNGVALAPSFATPAGSGDVTSSANITDNAIVRGDGGAKGVQTSGITISDTNSITFPSEATPITYTISSATQTTADTAGNALTISPGAGNGTANNGDLQLISPNRTVATPGTQLSTIGSIGAFTGTLTIINGGLNDTVQGSAFSLSTPSIDTGILRAGAFGVEGGGIEVTDETDYASSQGGAVSLGGGTVEGSGVAGGASISLEGGTWDGVNFNGGGLYLDAGEGDDANGVLELIQYSGLYRFDSGQGDIGIFDFSLVATSDKTFTFPNTTGTIALTSNITGTNSNTNTGDQTITNSSDATSHTVTLSASGGSVQLIEGANISLTTGGTGSAGTVTIAATAGSGITRTQVTTSGSLTLGATASTDYVYYVAGAHTLSMPSPNNNRYTIKNNHSAAITIDTAGAETIEGAASITLNPESAVEITSDGTNWYVF